MTTTNNLLKEATAWEMRNFIEHYHILEKGSLEVGFALIRNAVPKMASHLCDQWRWKKKSFGGFYLNLSYPSQIAFLHEFRIVAEQDEKYLKDMEENEVRMIFAPPPPVAGVMNKMLLFFENHAIEPNAYDWWPQLINVPESDEKCYGNSYNWSDYILSLPWNEQQKLLTLIKDNYKS